jgi:hypothetical protein
MIQARNVHNSAQHSLAAAAGLAGAIAWSSVTVTRIATVRVRWRARLSASPETLAPLSMVPARCLRLVQAPATARKCKRACALWPARAAARAAPASERNRFGTDVSESSNSRCASAGLPASSKSSPSSSRIGKSRFSMATVFSVRSSRSAAARIEATASSTRRSPNAIHALAASACTSAIRQRSVLHHRLIFGSWLSALVHLVLRANARSYPCSGAAPGRP